MVHCRQADLYKQKGGIINKSTYNKYMEQLCSISRQKLDCLGINEDNASEISEYAKRMFKIDRFDEVEAEYEALKGE